ncbi:9813_t:CDS:2 [Entrophospora sp. SA101]|nr:9813_t:CDS:2 [Entrophospora sp. SA101]
MKDAGINFSVKYLDEAKPRISDSSDDDIPRNYEKTSEFRCIKKLVKKLNKSKCRECDKLFHDPNLGSYCEKHILNKLAYDLFDSDSQSGDAIKSDN